MKARGVRWALAWGIVAMLAVPALGYDPVVSVITPVGLQRGTTTEVAFSGVRLKDARQLLFYEPGITVKKLTPVNDRQVKVELAVDPKCRLGIHAVRLITATGISNLRTFTVGALPQINEKEPNSSFDKPQEVPINHAVLGVVQNEDVDYFAVKLKKGQQLTAELEGIRLGYTFFDPYLAILDSKRFELARSDDFPLLRQDALCSIVAPADGTYIVMVRESAYGGNGNCRYRLHLGQFPRPVSVFPGGGRPGETVTLELRDAAGRTWSDRVVLPSDGASFFDYYAKTATGTAPSPNRLRVADLPNVIEKEPNNDPKQATAAVAPGALNGRIDAPGDVDYFRFEAKKGQRFDIRVYGRKVLRSPIDTVIYIRRASNHSVVAANDDSGGPDSYVRFTAPEDGAFLVQVVDHLRDGGPDFVYRVEIEPVRPKLVMNMPERFRYVSTVVPVPRGNRMAVLVSASRRDFGGELAIDFPGLPAGLTVAGTQMPANRSVIPVLFTAAPGAAPQGQLTPVIGRCQKPEVVGQLDQRTLLVRGQNNRDVWGHNTDRLAVAVTEEAPFSIDVVAPKVPIVRNGTMHLKVVAKRRKDFKTAIGVRLLYNPSGVSASGSISIPEGKTEATIPMTAAGNAALQEWPIVVIGRAGMPGGGTAYVSSQMVSLRVAEPYVQLKFEKTAVELGQESEVVIGVEHKHDFKGKAEVELVGIPAKVEIVSGPKTLDAKTEQLVYKIRAAKDARPGKYQTLVCRIKIIENGEPILHVLGRGEVRIDKPLPPKAAAPKPKKKAPPKPAAKPKPKKKRLSRLEQLRLQRQKAKQGMP